MGRSDLRVLHDADQVGSTLTFAASKAMFRRRPQSSCSAVSCTEWPCFVNSQVRKLPPTSPKTGMNLLCRVCEHSSSGHALQGQPYAANTSRSRGTWFVLARRNTSSRLPLAQNSATMQGGSRQRPRNLHEVGSQHSCPLLYCACH